MSLEPDPLIGRTLASFHLLERIDAGGMARVYRAHDGKLHRDVALKVLSPELMADEVSRARFQREPVALSMLTHHAIAAVYELRHDDGFDYFVMEYIPGESLEKRIARGALPEHEVVAIGRQLAEGLEAAHHRGVIHRDIKPSNVMYVAPGQIKILDFGVASFLEPPFDGAKLTRSETVPGTHGYVAPELWQNGEANARSDLYGAGLVLYQAAMGSLAVPSLKGAELLQAMRSTRPASRSGRMKPVSRELAELIVHCLEEDPRNRPTSAAALERELARIAERGQRWWEQLSMKTGIIASLAVIALGFSIYKVIEQFTRPPVRSLAVLRFGGPSGEVGTGPYTSGLPEELVAQLSNLRSLHVVSWASSRRPDPSRTSPQQIAAELGVQGLVMGDIQLEGDKLRITAHLVDGPLNKTLWTDSYKGDTADLPKLKDRVARAIVHEVAAKMSASERERFKEQRKTDPAAYTLYLRGRFHWNRRPAELDRAVDCFSRAIGRDSTYAAAYAGLADAWSAVGLYGVQPPLATRARARAAALRAVELDDGLAEAHHALAHVFHNYDWDWEAAEMEYRRAVALNPNYAPAHHGYAHLLAQLRRFPEARRELDRALELDPLSTISIMAGGVFEYYAGELDSALVRVRQAAEVDSANPLVSRLHAAILDRQGHSSEAIGALVHSLQLQGHGALAAATQNAYDRAGLTAALDVLIGAYLRKRASGAYEPAEHVAELHARLGRNDEAFRWLEVAFREHDTELNRLYADPIFDPLRGDPRFADLLRRLGFPAGGS